MIFIDNKYTKCYYSIINNAKSRISINGYMERHHIIPKSLGGNNKKENIISLTAKEHFICHLLLTKMVNGNSKRKMIFASNMMLQGKHRYVPTGKIYQQIKEQFAISISEQNKGKTAWNKGLSGNFLGKQHTDETKTKMSLAQTGLSKPRTVATSDITKSRISMSKTGQKYKTTSEEGRKNKSTCKLGDKNHNFGKTPSDETISRMSESAKARPKYECQCGKSVSPSNFKRWHGENCKKLRNPIC